MKMRSVQSAKILFLVAGCSAAACNQGTTFVSVPEEAGTIIGRVVEAPGNTPLEGAVITTVPSVPAGTTDAAGHFTLTDLTLETEYVISARKPGYLSQSVTVPVTERQRWISVELILHRLP